MFFVKSHLRYPVKMESVQIVSEDVGEGGSGDKFLGNFAAVASQRTTRFVPDAKRKSGYQ